MILFPDTNFFLHFKDPVELPWSDVTSDQQVRLVICVNTLRELDKKKFELRGRAQDRARKWATIVRELIETESPKEVRASGPAVTVELSLEWPPGWTPPQDLDTLATGDDRYVADALAFQSTSASECFLLTADTGPLWKGRRHGLRVISPMRSDWELPQEADSRDKELRQLQKELREARQGPALSGTFSLEGKPAKHVELYVTRYSPLSEQKIQQLLDELQVRHPRATEFPQPAQSNGSEASSAKDGVFDIAMLEPPFDWVPPTDDQITSYHTAYSDWLRAARQLMETVPSDLQEKVFQTEFTFALENTGISAAENVWVSFQASSGLLLCNDESDAAKADADDDKLTDVGLKVKPSALRAPPSPPQWKKIYRKVESSGAGSAANSYRSALEEARRAMGGIDRLGDMLSAQDRFAKLTGGSALDLLRQQSLFGRITDSRMPSIRDWHVPVIPRVPQHDPEAFYLRRNARQLYSASWDFDCDLFRHKVEPEVWLVRVTARLDSLPNGGAVHVQVHARNLGTPYDRAFPVSIVSSDADTEGLVRGLLPL